MILPSRAEALAQAMTQVLSQDNPDAGRQIILCRRAPICTLEGEDREAAMFAGCLRCERLFIGPEGHA